MFGLSAKERAGEALLRGTRAALSGGFLHLSRVEGLGLNESAGAWVYAESIAHQIYALGLAYTNSIRDERPWADGQFFDDHVASALHSVEKEQGLTTGSFSFVFTRLKAFQQFSRQELVAGKQFALSANEARNHDSNADVAVIERLLHDATEQYFQASWKMFTT